MNKNMQVVVFVVVGVVADDVIVVVNHVVFAVGAVYLDDAKIQK